MPNIMQAHKFEMVLHFNGETKRQKILTFRLVEKILDEITDFVHCTSNGFMISSRESDESTTEIMYSNGIFIQVFQLA